MEGGTRCVTNRSTALARSRRRLAAERDAREHGQVGLFEDREVIVHRADPPTSALAAREITASGRRGAQKRMILDWLRLQTVPVTSAELARASSLDRHLVAKRLPDLRADGLVQQRDARLCGVTGRACITWVFTS